ncbi:uncharacterized protein LOC111874931 isoform X2 [Cryptotermes secundus]|uniref:uncharacterized protein LOC111874931 isoform X2 n=1 Tax=Cryptotermes secundus TaxID=105785 RepID=UPI000CD7D8BB|nr:uncharacterized protein LOC111874931 isoform X2 [Cryptotermes secundus]
MFATASVLVAAILTCAAVTGLSPPGPVLEEPELKSVIVAAQDSLRKTFSELESAADSAMTSAREVLESTTLQANHTVLESQASLQDLLESITTTIATAVYNARKLGANITSCISGQEEAARSVVKQTGRGDRTHRTSVNGSGQALFGNHVISRNGDIAWPSRSPDLSVCDFYLWGYLKSVVYNTRPTTLAELRRRITEEIAAINSTVCSEP